MIEICEKCGKPLDKENGRVSFGSVEQDGKKLITKNHIFHYYCYFPHFLKPVEKKVIKKVEMPNSNIDKVR